MYVCKIVGARALTRRANSVCGEQLAPGAIIKIFSFFFSLSISHGGACPTIELSQRAPRLTAAVGRRAVEPRERRLERARRHEQLAIERLELLGNVATRRL